jgi:hypothetical protein
MKIASEQDFHLIDCPGCGDKLKIPKEKATHTITENDNSPILAKLEALEKRLAEKAEPAAPKEPEKKPEGPALPSYMPGYRCAAGDDCTRVHKNKNHKAKIKGKCSNCDQFSSASKGPCPWCEDGELEAVDEDELEDLKIRKPDVHGDEE